MFIDSDWSICFHQASSYIVSLQLSFDYLPNWFTDDLPFWEIQSQFKRNVRKCQELQAAGASAIRMLAFHEFIIESG